MIGVLNDCYRVILLPDLLLPPGPVLLAEHRPGQGPEGVRLVSLLLRHPPNYGVEGRPVGVHHLEPRGDGVTSVGDDRVCPVELSLPVSERL